MRKNIHLISAVSICIANSLVINTAYANNEANNVSIKSATTPQKEASVMHFNPYFSLSGGYGSFLSMSNGSGKTSFGRFALGVKSSLRSNMSMGGEVGIQSAKRMELSNQTLAPFFVNAAYPLPVYLTISPPIDVLATFTYHLPYPVYFEAKVGGAYMQSMIDQADMSGASQFNPELQLGVGFDVIDNARLILNYQRIFNSTPRLDQIDLTVGTARLANLPSWQGLMITLEKNF